MDDKNIIQELTKISEGQKFLTQQFVEFREELKKQISKIERQQQEDKEIIIDIKHDVRLLKNHDEEHTKNIKALQDERNVNIVEFGKKETPTVIKAGLVGILLFTLVNTISQIIVMIKTITPP